MVGLRSPFPGASLRANKERNDREIDTRCYQGVTQARSTGYARGLNVGEVAGPVDITRVNSVPARRVTVRYEV